MATEKNRDNFEYRWYWLQALIRVTMNLERVAVTHLVSTIVRTACTLAVLAACGGRTPPASEPKAAESPDPRAALRGGPNAAEAVSNLKILARAASPQQF